MTVVGVHRRLKNLFADDRGADVVEYGLLALLFGIVGVLVWGAVQGDINTGLTNWDANMQSHWEVPPPLP